jgi:hypothetical protein
MNKRKRPLARHDPVAWMLRGLKSGRVASAKAYHCKAKHKNKSRPDIENADGLRLFLCPESKF